MLANATPIPEALLAHYAETGSEPVKVERAALEGMGVRVVEVDLLAEGDLIRHDFGEARRRGARPGRGDRVRKMTSHPPRVAVILAAGKGTRMRRRCRRSSMRRPGGRSSPGWWTPPAPPAARRILVVVGHGAERVQAEIAGTDITWVLQAEQRGTGHALAQAAPHLDGAATLLVLSGDVPLVTPATLAELARRTRRAAGAPWRSPTSPSRARSGG